MTTGGTHGPMGNEIAYARRSLLGVAGVSGAINLLMLSGSIYMLQVYDRVLPSRSLSTLFGLSVLVLGAYLLQGCLEAIRSRMLTRISGLLDASLQEPIYAAAVELAYRGAAPTRAQQPLRDLELVRTFLSGMGPTAFLDMPWLPVFLIVLFLFHPLMGIVAVMGAALIVLTAMFAEVQARKFARGSVERGLQRAAFVDEVTRNADVLRVLGMNERLKVAWRSLNNAHISQTLPMRDCEADIGALAKMLRFALQSTLLAVGAALVIGDRASGGIIIASSIMMGRALAPIEIVLGTWKQLIAARGAVDRLVAALDKEAPAKSPALLLPAPCNTLLMQNVSVAPPGSDRVVLRDLSFLLTAGSGLAVVGGSGAGKSSLVRALVGSWQPIRGHIRLDGVRLDRWDCDRLGAHIGYLPQDVSLFDGSIADNICRFEPQPRQERILEAARNAGAHELIMGMPDGYQTRIGERGARLSAGQRQRVGLARALYGNPFLVVLDEPNANLDTEGEAALALAIRQLRRRKAIVVVVSHRADVLKELDMVLALSNGVAVAFGSQEKLKAALAGSPAKTAHPAAPDRAPVQAVAAAAEAGAP